jgi:hypothetical protein
MFLGSRERPVRNPDNLTAICVPIVLDNVGPSTACYGESSPFVHARNLWRIFLAITCISNWNSTVDSYYQNHRYHFYSKELSIKKTSGCIGRNINKWRINRMSFFKKRFRIKFLLEHVFVLCRRPTFKVAAFIWRGIFLIWYRVSSSDVWEDSSNGIRARFFREVGEIWSEREFSLIICAFSSSSSTHALMASLFTAASYYNHASFSQNRWK